MRRSICVPWPGEDVPSPNAPTAAVKKSGTDWEYWTSQIDNHLKLQTVAKRCTFRESRKSPALRGFVSGRWALATTSLYPSTKIERPQRARNGAPRRHSFFEIEWPRWSGLPHRNCSRQLPPHTRPNAVQTPLIGAPPPPLPRNRHTGPTRPRQGVPSDSTVLCLSHRMPWTGQKWVRASARKMRLAAACGKPGALLRPTQGRVNRFPVCACQPGSAGCGYEG